MGQEIELAILFADVVGSTKLYEILGDERAREMVAHCIDVMRQATEQNQGTVIKTMGDEVMATFPGADDALTAACQMQQGISGSRTLAVEGVPVAIRIGCHFGPVVLEDRDIFGSAVHTANRMTSQAKAAQIITTAITVEQLSPEWQATTRLIDVATVKGQSDEVALYEVIWQPDDATSMVPALRWTDRDERKIGSLKLHYKDLELVVNEEHPSLTIGRADDNDLVIKGTLISRLHARIELNRTKFMLVDESTNGTFVQTGDGEETLVRRDSLQITGEGTIGLGRSTSNDSPQTIRYRCVD